MNIIRWISLALSSLLSLAACSSGSPPTPAPPVPTAACAPVGLGEAHPRSAAYQTLLDDYVERGFPGLTAAVYTPDDGLWVGAAGVSSVAAKTAMRSCDAFFSGSVAKMYTVTAAMAQVESGQLNLDDTVAWHLPAATGNGLPNATLASVGQLMNHTAGMPDHDDDEALSDYVDSHQGRLPSAEAQLAYLFDDSARFVPGESVAYSSAHTVALSLVLDSTSGAHHSKLVTERIIAPLALRETYYKNEAGYPAPLNLVNGYLGFGSRLKNVTAEAINYAEGSQGDAGIIATAHDYYRFMRALMEGQLVSAAILEQMKEPVWAFDDGQFAFGYGLGLFAIGLDGELVKIGHSGSTLGGMSHVYYYPATGSYLVLLSNTLVEDNAQALRLWGAELLVGTGEPSMVADFEALLL